MNKILEPPVNKSLINSILERLVTNFDVIKYPGETATLEESGMALKTMKKIRKVFRKKFSLPGK